MFETIKDLELLLLLLLEEAADGKSGGFLLLCLTSFTMLALQDDLNRLQPSNMYPPEGFYPSGSNDPFWSWHYDLFKHKFRFRLEHFHRLTRAIDFEDKCFNIGAPKHKHMYRADVCLLVVLRRLSFPVRFYDMVEDFGIASHRLCEIFHFTVDLIFEKFHAVIDFATWLPFFPQFAQIFQAYGSPYEDLVALTDGNFMPTCRPGGLGNKNSKIDQSQFYTGEKARHGVKHLGAFFRTV